jgi:hypothetical protein
VKYFSRKKKIGEQNNVRALRDFGVIVLAASCMYFLLALLDNSKNNVDSRHDEKK